MILLSSSRGLWRRALLMSLTLVFVGVRITHSAETNQVTLQGYLSRRGYEAVPLKRSEENHLFTEGRINGRKAVIMLDTGADATVVDQRDAAGIKPVKKIKGRLSGVFGVVATEVPLVVIDKIEIGPVPREAQPALVVNLHSGSEAHLDSLIPRSGRRKEYDLILGLDFLRRTYAIIDYHGSTLFLRKEEPGVGLAVGFEQAVMRGGFLTVPLVFTNSHLVVTGMINDRPANFLVDTGAFVTQVDEHQAEGLGLNVREKLMKAIDLGGKKSDVFFTWVQTLRLGGFVHGKLPVAVVNLEALNKPLGKEKPFPTQGLLGPEVLDSGLAIIDCFYLNLYLYQGNQIPSPKR
jgi:predicted aspartyl protease